MKSIENRISRLEAKHDPDRITGIDIVIVNCKEHVDHPERFRKVLESEEVSETGFKRRMFHLERKPDSE